MNTTVPSSPDSDQPPVPTITGTGSSPGSDDGPENGSETEGSDEGSGREAAKYRRRLRDAEADRDAGRTSLEALRRQVVEDASGLAKPGGIWAAGVDVHAMFGADGRLDREKLTAAVTEAADQLGLTRAPRTPRPDPSQGSTSAPQGDTWLDALRRR